MAPAPGSTLGNGRAKLLSVNVVPSNRSPSQLPRAQLRRRALFLLGAALLGAVLLLGALLVALPATAQEQAPVLHEYMPPDLAEDIDFSSTNASGQLPAAVQTPSGMISPPDVRTTPDPSQVYHQNDSGGFKFRPDRDTRRPDVERYDDPFTPNLTPFKRLHAYDAVRDDYSLYVRDSVPVALTPGGTATDDDDRFFADLSVALRAGERIRIPTVGPDARLLSVVSKPKTTLEFSTDSAGNWFVMAQTNDRVRLVLDIAIDRDAFASEFADVAWSDLPKVPLQPSAHRRSFETVRKAIDISRASMRPREVVTKMVEYFRAFTPSDEAPTGQGDIYLDLALSRKGVCRHRAFGFLVTALNIGIPARLIHNEAHAWVEVRDDQRWHRIDLGGAALDLDDNPHLDRPPHVPPPDQFQWPRGRDSGADLAHRNREEAIEEAGPDANGAGNGGVGDPNAPGPIDPLAPPDPNAPPLPSDRPETKLEIEEIDADIFRGLPVKIRGTAVSQGQPCSHIRIDVLLTLDGAEEETRLGSLSTDEKGRYSGEVVMPANIPVGDHELVITTPGNNVCGTGATD